MKTKIIPIIGDTAEQLYQIARSEQEGYEKIYHRVHSVLSANEVLRYGNEIISKAKSKLKKNGTSYFNQCIQAYAEGLRIDPSEYMSFLSIFEIAAHYGQLYPEVRGLFPGCTSVFQKRGQDIVHTRLIDLALVDLFELNPRLYYWKTKGRPSLLSYSCEGLAPIFMHTIHDSGFSLALHHKPGQFFHRDGESIFQIMFEGLFNASNLNDFRKNLKSMSSITKWGVYGIDNKGTILAADIEGPSTIVENFEINTNKSQVFNNIPLRKDADHFLGNYLEFCMQRIESFLDVVASTTHESITLETLTHIQPSKKKKWKHPTSTLSTLAAIEINLSQGIIQFKEGSGALTLSDPIYELSLSQREVIRLVKESKEPNDFEKAWKMASKAQSFYDQNLMDHAYHWLQMSISLMPDKNWKEIFTFFLCVWDFKLISHKKDLAFVYRTMKELQLPSLLQVQHKFMLMRLEKKLNLSFTQSKEDLPLEYRKFFKMECDASKTIFLTWMKLIYPRLDVLDVFSPHHK